MPATLTSTVAPVVTLAEESISFAVSVGAGPFQFDAGTNFNWSVFLSDSALPALLIVLRTVQVLPSLEYCQVPLAAAAV